MEKFEITFMNKKTGSKHTEMVNNVKDMQEALTIGLHWIDDAFGNPDLQDCEIIKISKDWKV